MYSKYPKPVIRNFYDPSCKDCSAAVPREHTHKDGLWYVPSKGRLNWTHRLFWHTNRHAWQCSCEFCQLHGSCKHIEAIQPFVRDGLTRAPYPKTVYDNGADPFTAEAEEEDYAALFEHMLSLIA